MHRTLRIQEILSVIFDCCSPGMAFNEYPCKDADRDLAALARTCRTFKEPALDMLWRVLSNLSPLARCLPEVSHRVSPGDKYSFTEPLSQSEWNTLQGYTHRIRVILDFSSGLEWESVTTALNPPFSEPLFPKLRILRCDYTEKTMPLLRLPLPALDMFNVNFEDPRLLQSTFGSFPRLFPNVGILFLSVGPSNVAFSGLVSKSICQWRNLRTFVCPEIALDADALLHLSYMSALTHLAFKLSVTLPASSPSLFFSNLHNLTLRSTSLKPVSRLLSLTRLPAITDLFVFISRSPSCQDLISFLADIPSANARHTLERLQLTQSFPPFGDGSRRSEVPPLSLEDFRPCMKLHNLRHLELDVEYNVRLTDSDVMVLTSAWPLLEHLLLNRHWGWNSGSGVTLDGLLQLLRTHQSLSQIALRLDTQGYTKVPLRHTQARLGLTLPPNFSIDVVDSSIERESMTALTLFLSGLGACCESDFSLCVWGGAPMVGLPDIGDHMTRWYRVCDRVDHTLHPRDDSSDDSDSFSSLDSESQRILMDFS